MLDPTIDTSLRQQGLTPAPKSWSQFGFMPSLAALECPWGAEGSTAAQAYYAWAQFAPGERDTFLQLVAENGYAFEETDRGTWLSTPPELESSTQSATLIGPDWVAFANTRPEIDHIVWAR